LYSIIPIPVTDYFEARITLIVRVNVYDGFHKNFPNSIPFPVQRVVH